MSIVTLAERFCSEVEKRGGKLIGSYHSSDNKVELQCSNGHIFSVLPRDLVSYGNWCRRCSLGSDKAREDFFSLVTMKGGKVLGEYRDTSTKVDIECAHGHRFSSIPSGVKSGKWCIFCYRTRTKENLHSKFMSVLEEKGGKLLTEYLRGGSLVRIECALGHQFERLPRNVNKGLWCPWCAPNTSVGKFLSMVSKKGGKIVSQYRRNHIPVELECSQGHSFELCPSFVLQGYWCNFCDQSVSRGAFSDIFRSLVAEKDGEVIGEYTGSTSRIEVRCEKGHVFSSTPSNIVNCDSWCDHPCCSRRSWKDTEAAFRLALQESAATLLDEYRLSKEPVKIKCANGHIVMVTPRRVIHRKSWCYLCGKSGSNSSRDSLSDEEDA